MTEERRQETSILLQLVQTVHDDVKALALRLDTHMKDEEEEMNGIFARIDSVREESESRHAALIQSINSYMDKTIDIEQAFLRDKDGNPDLKGHYYDHDTRKGIRDWVVGAGGSGLKKVFEAGVFAGTLWLLYMVWEAILKGPK